jgi:predicted O-linked N-acetylglucosamine transferase (SPINDLY family)
MSDPSLSPETIFRQAVAHHQAGRLAEAADAYRRVLDLRPDHAATHFNLGQILFGQGKADEAAAAFARAVALKPDDAEAHLGLGAALKILGRLDAAADALERTVALKPDLAPAHNNLGNVLQAQGRLEEAVDAYQRARALKPDYPEASYNLGNALAALERLDAARDAYTRALALNPNLAKAHCNLGTLLQSQGRIDESLAHYRRALELEPDFVACHQNLLTGILYHPGLDDAARLAEHLRFARDHAPAGVRPRPHPNVPDPDRRLRLGYLSADLRDHPVACNLIPLIEARDRSRFELFLYADLRRLDDASRRFRELADGWRVVAGLSDAEVADRIRADGIDILVCLAGRFEGNRPLVAAHTPAPVQVSFFDPATSGLAAMDYLIADPVMVPRRSKESFVERVVRLPSYHLAQPIDAAPPVAPPPMLASGVPTFGCFNNPAKITDRVLDLWGELMGEVPGSRLLLKFRRLYASAALRERVHAALGARGVGPERVVLRAETQSLADHLALYSRIDVALDPFPFSGSTTTFESLWMGAPVVTLAGEFMVGRWSASMLSATGLSELVAASPAEYIAICCRLAAAPRKLAELRAGLRARVATSPLCDAKSHARHIERLYRAFWRRWCRSARANPRAPDYDARANPRAHDRDTRP